MQFLISPILSAFFVGAFFLGGAWMIVPGIVAVIIAIPLDEAVGDDWSKRLEQGSGILLKGLLLIQLPSIGIASALYAYYLSDLTFLGPTIDAARDRTEIWQLILTTAVLGSGIYAIAGIVVAHELVHRNDRMSVLIAQWLLSFSFETAFALEHIYGHHVHVGTPSDPATALRGQGFWSYFVRMLYLRNRDAWRIEQRFLKNRGLPTWSLRNRFLTGQMMSLVWVGLFAIIAGWIGLLAFAAATLLAKLNLELSNYIEHYGLVRVQGSPVSARHSWNSSRRISNLLLFNLPRHADHHLKPARKYWELEARIDAPQLPRGHFSMVFLAMVPPLFRLIMKRPLADWDTRLASSGERAIIGLPVQSDEGV